MDKVWLLRHVHEFDDGHEDVKLIGVFGTREEAEQALSKVADKPGFREHPEGFSIDDHQLGLMGWVEGFITIEPGEE